MIHHLMMVHLILWFQMILKNLSNSRLHLLFWDSQGHQESENVKLWKKEEEKKPEKKVENLNPTEDGEASEKAHGAPDQTQLGF